VPTPFSQLLRERRDRVVARFVSEIRRKDLPPEGLTGAHLVDHIPEFLDEIAAELARRERGPASIDAGTSEHARQHGEQRWGLGYDIQALIREYDVLRRCILHEAKEAGIQAN
jgi:hypothetical protein